MNRLLGFCRWCENTEEVRSRGETQEDGVAKGM